MSKFSDFFNFFGKNAPSPQILRTDDDWVNFTKESFPGYRPGRRRMTAPQNLVFSLLIIVGYLVFGWIFNFPEPTCVLKSDIGTFLCVVGLLLFISNVVRIFMDVPTTLLLLVSAVVIYGVGTGLALWGFFATLCGLGVVLFYTCSLLRPPLAVWFLAFMMVVLGYTLSDLTEGTQKPEPDLEEAWKDNPSVTWKITIHVKGSYGNYPYEFTTIGTRASAVEFAKRQMVKLTQEGRVGEGEYCSFDPDYYPDLNIAHVPSELMLTVGNILGYRDSKRYEDGLLP